MRDAIYLVAVCYADAPLTGLDKDGIIYRITMYPSVEE
jgi:hypothetical protein